MTRYLVIGSERVKLRPFLIVYFRVGDQKKDDQCHEKDCSSFECTHSLTGALRIYIFQEVIIPPTAGIQTSFGNLYLFSLVIYFGFYNLTL